LERHRFSLGGRRREDAVVEALIEEAPTSANDPAGSTPFMFAVRKGDSVGEHAFLAAGVNVNEKGLISPRRCRRIVTAVVDLLLEGGPNVGRIDRPVGAGLSPPDRSHSRRLLSRSAEGCR
jgi:hypothetical protein